MANKCGLPKEPPTPYCKQPQSMLKNYTATVP